MYSHCSDPQIFLTLMERDLSRVLTFVVISFFGFLSWLFVYYLVPETKGRPIEDIVEELCPEMNEETRQLRKSMSKEEFDTL